MPRSPGVSLCTLSPYPDRSSLPLPEEVIVVVSAGCLPVALLLPEDAGRVDGAAVQNGPRHPGWKERVSGGFVMLWEPLCRDRPNPGYFAMC